MNDDIVTAAKFVTPHEAELARGFLEANGIDAYLSGTDFPMVTYHAMVTHRGIRLQVRRGDLDRARELLANPEPLSDFEWE